MSGLVFTAFESSLRADLSGAGMSQSQAAQIAADLRQGANAQEEAAAYAVPLQEVAAVGESEQQAMIAGVRAQGLGGAVVSFVTAGVFVVARRAQGRAAGALASARA